MRGLTLIITFIIGITFTTEICGNLQQQPEITKNQQVKQEAQQAVRVSDWFGAMGELWTLPTKKIASN